MPDDESGRNWTVIMLCKSCISQFILKGMDNMTKRLVIVSCIVAMALLVFSGCAMTEQAKVPKFVLRVNCAGSEPYTDKAGNSWLVDQYMESDTKWGAVGGMTVDRGDLGMTGTNSPKVYETERYSMDAYKFSIPNGSYTVRLHFAETYDGITGDGQRVFSITIDEKTVLEDFDPYKEAGGFQKPVVKTIKSLTVTNEELVIGFISNIQNPEINGIEILSE